MFYVTKERQCTPWPQAHGRGDLSRPFSMYAGMQGRSQPHAADSFCGTLRSATEKINRESFTACGHMTWDSRLFSEICATIIIKNRRHSFACMEMRSMTTINYINLSLELWGCVMSAVVAACLLLSKCHRHRTTRLYFGMLLFNTCSLFFDAAALLFRGRTDVFAWWGVRASNSIAFSCNYLLLAAFAYYLTEFLGRRTKKVSRNPLQIIWTLCALSLMLVVATQFFPIVYSVDAKNVYHRESLFWFSQAIGIVGMLLCAGMLLRYRHVIEAEEKIALWSYIVLPVAALCVQAFVYGMVLLGLANTVSLIVVFLFLQAEQGRCMAEQDAALTQSRISIMLSQIQPHFLYNSLNTIRYLCKADPDRAQKAVDDFATYLRGNLDSLKRTAPVSLDTELEHIRIYLSLEKCALTTNCKSSMTCKPPAFCCQP